MGGILWNVTGNIQDLLSDRETPKRRRFGEAFTRPKIPFGSMVEYYPVSTNDQSRFHQFGKKVSLEYSDGKTPYERRFGMPFNGPVIPFGAMVENYQFLRKTYRDYMNLVQKSYQVYSLDMCCPRGDSGEET